MSDLKVRPPNLQSPARLYHLRDPVFCGYALAAPAAKIFLEVALKLKHVSQIIGAWETEPAVNLRGHAVVADFLTQRFGKGGRHLCAGQVVAGDPNGHADEFAALLENAVRALADVLDRDARQLLVAHGKSDGQLSIRASLGAAAEVNEVVPIE